MKHKTFFLSDFLKVDSEHDPNDANIVSEWDFLTKVGKLFLFHEATLIKQRELKHKSMNFTLCEWLDKDIKIKNLAEKDAHRITILAIYDVYEVVQTKVETLKRTLQTEAEALNYQYPNAYYEDEYPDDIEYDADYHTSINFPLEPDQTITRIKYVTEMLRDRQTIDMLSDRELTFLQSACSTVRLSQGQKDFFLSIQGKINRIRAARI